MKARHPQDQGGYAMLAVLLVLLSILFVLAPFLATVGNADATASRRSDEAAANLALDNAARLGKARLAATHRAWDATPYSDSAAELDVRNDLESAFADMNGTRWDLDVEDLAGRVDLDSAPPVMVANLLGLTTRLSEFMAEADTKLVVASTAGFPERGVVWVAGELIRYEKLTPNSFEELTRGLGSELDDEGAVLPGPLPPVDAPAGTVVVDQRALALAQWRIAGVGEGDEVGGRRDPRQFGSPDRLAQVGDFVVDGDWGPGTVAPLFDQGTVHGAWGSGPQWLTGTRVQNPIVAGETMALDVAEPRWFGPGTTLRIHGDGRSEFAIVRAVSPRNGRLYLDRPLANEQLAFGAVAEPMARRAVNANTASKETLEALFKNVRLAGRNSRITAGEARQIAEVLVESRPFDGFEDFVERFVFPAGGIAPLPADAPVVPAALADGASFLTREDALAVYRNALMPNDISLEVSTMPLCFTSRDVYRFELRASVTAESGVERLDRVREEVHAIAPQDELLAAWVRQEDFEDELRLSRQAKGWNTGPYPTTRYDGFLKSDPPARFRAHLGSEASLSEPDPNVEPFPGIFADREQDGFLQALPSRVEEVAPLSGHVFHFDWEEDTNLGRNVAERPLQLDADDPRLAWIDTSLNGLMRPIHFSAWIRPRTTGGYLLDVVGDSQAADRVKLFVEGSDLVLQVLDGAGDHPGTVFQEVGEVRYPLDTGPGLPNDVWSHVLVDVRGNRPDQMILMVDQRPAVETKGRTRLTQNLLPSAGQIAVDSTDGFPDHCTIRIGSELIEVRVQNPTTFLAQHATIGTDAGFGGRLARELFTSSGGQLPWVNGGLFKAQQYAAGTSVELYGYSAPILRDVTNGFASLQGALGPFAVARAIGAVGGQSSDGDAIQWQSALAQTPLDLGTGMEGLGSGVTGIRLAAADTDMQTTDAMRAFSPTGGYAAIVQLAQGARIDTEGAEFTANGTPLFDIEVVHYSGWAQDVLTIDKRGSQCGELSLLAGTTMLQNHAFVFNWNPQLTLQGTGQPLNTIATWQTFVVPISIDGGSGGGGTFGFPTPPLGTSEYAQITRKDSAELTEWVRYDQVAGGQLVRSDPGALTQLGNVLLGGTGAGTVGLPNPTGSGSGGSGGGSVPGVPGTPGSLILESKALEPPLPANLVGAYWDHIIGTEEYAQYPVTRAVQTQLQFRGVMGTFSHDQPTGALILPVARVRDQGLQGGLPGRFDRAFLMDADPTFPGWPVTVHRAYRPNEHLEASFDNAPAGGVEFATVASTTTIAPDAEAQTGVVFVAFQERLQIPIVVGAPIPGSVITDARQTARLTKFPSGERPRIVDTVHVGQENVGGGVADAVVDEAVFLSNQFGLSTGAGDPVLGGGLLLQQPMGANDVNFFVDPSILRMPLGLFGTTAPLLLEVARDAGLARIGDELIVYSDYDPIVGDIKIAPNGRGVLGTQPAPHLPGDLVTFLDWIPVTQLASNTGPDEAELVVEDIAGFASEGTLLSEEELLHYTRRENGQLVMPRASTEPGERDGRGAGIYRGRFGTDAAQHSTGAWVMGHVFRYWDRYTLQSDAPELHYFGFNPSQPDAYWMRGFWNSQYDRGGPWIGMLVRTDPSIPWDADPEATEGLYLFDGGKYDRGGNPLGFQADRIEARLFLTFRRGAFDPIDNLNPGWKVAPEVTAVGFEFIAPGAVFERLWK